MMMFLQFLVVLAFIFLGARLGSIGIGFAGGAGLLALAILGVTISADQMPVDVITIIMAVIAAIATMQVAGGMDYLVRVAEKILRRNPKHLNFLAPIVTYLMTIMAGTGHTAFSMIPVITEVAKENDMRPSRPLSIAVPASQMAITASPISAAVVAFSAMLEPQGVDYLQLLAIAIPATFIACMITAAIMMMIDKARGTAQLHTLEIYQERLKAGVVAPPKGVDTSEIPATGKKSVMVFLSGLVIVMIYATMISDKVGLKTNALGKHLFYDKTTESIVTNEAGEKVVQAVTSTLPIIGRDAAIIAIMLGVATVIALTCKVNTVNVLSASVFKSGMSAVVCVLGVAWLGTAFVRYHEGWIKDTAGDLLTDHPWTLAIVLFFASALLYSQAATTRALMPTALSIGVAPLAAIAAFPAVSALFVLPTYPTLLAAVEMDDTGSTRIGKYVFDHPFVIPGVINIAISVALGFLFGSIIL